MKEPAEHVHMVTRVRKADGVECVTGGSDLKASQAYPEP